MASVYPNSAAGKQDSLNTNNQYYPQRINIYNDKPETFYVNQDSQATPGSAGYSEALHERPRNLQNMSAYAQASKPADVPAPPAFKQRDWQQPGSDYRQRPNGQEPLRQAVHANMNQNMHRNMPPYNGGGSGGGRPMGGGPPDGYHNRSPNGAPRMNPNPKINPNQNPRMQPPMNPNMNSRMKPPANSHYDARYDAHGGAAPGQQSGYPSRYDAEYYAEYGPSSTSAGYGQGAKPNDFGDRGNQDYGSSSYGAAEYGSKYNADYYSEYATADNGADYNNQGYGSDHGQGQKAAYGSAYENADYNSNHNGDYDSRHPPGDSGGALDTQSRYNQGGSRSSHDQYSNYKQPNTGYGSSNSNSNNNNPLAKSRLSDESHYSNDEPKYGGSDTSHYTTKPAPAPAHNGSGLSPYGSTTAAAAYDSKPTSDYDTASNSQYGIGAKPKFTTPDPKQPYSGYGSSNQPQSGLSSDAGMNNRSMTSSQKNQGAYSNGSPSAKPPNMTTTTATDMLFSNSPTHAQDLYMPPKSTTGTGSNTPRGGMSTPSSKPQMELDENQRRQKQQEEIEDALLADEASRMEAETDRILQQQKKLDLERLQKQLEELPPKAKKPILDKLTIFGAKQKKQPVMSQPNTPSTIATTVFSPAMSRGSSVETDPSAMAQQAMDEAARTSTGTGTGRLVGDDVPLSAVNGRERYVTVKCLTSTIGLSVSLDTTPVDILWATAKKTRHNISPAACVLMECYGKLNVDRRIRRYEHIRDVLNSWEQDTENILLVKACVSAHNDYDLDVGSVSRTAEAPEGFKFQMYHSSQKGKWNKRWICLKKSGQILASKKEDSVPGDKDVVNLCHMSDFDVYTPKEAEMRQQLKPPKNLCYAVKSQQRTNIFPDGENYIHFFCTDDDQIAKRFHDGVHAWRSWYLVNKKLKLDSKMDRPAQLASVMADGGASQSSKAPSLNGSTHRTGTGTGGFEPLLSMGSLDTSGGFDMAGVNMFGEKPQDHHRPATPKDSPYQSKYPPLVPPATTPNSAATASATMAYSSLIPPGTLGSDRSTAVHTPRTLQKAPPQSTPTSLRASHQTPGTNGSSKTDKGSNSGTPSKSKSKFSLGGLLGGHSDVFGRNKGAEDEMPAIPEPFINVHEVVYAPPPIPVVVKPAPKPEPLSWFPSATEHSAKSREGDAMLDVINVSHKVIVSKDDSALQSTSYSAWINFDDLLADEPAKPPVFTPAQAAPYTSMIDLANAAPAATSSRDRDPYGQQGNSSGRSHGASEQVAMRRRSKSTADLTAMRRQQQQQQQQQQYPPQHQQQYQQQQQQQYHQQQQYQQQYQQQMDYPPVPMVPNGSYGNSQANSGASSMSRAPAAMSNAARGYMEAPVNNPFVSSRTGGGRRAR